MTIVVAKIIIELVFWPVSVQCDHRQRDLRYSEFYQDDIPVYNEGYALDEDLHLHNLDLNNPFPTPDPLKDLELFFRNRANDPLDEEYESTPHPPRRKSGHKHHKHRHKGRKNQQKTTPSFGSYFTPSSINTNEAVDEYYDFLYEDEEVQSSEQPQFSNDRTNFNSSKKHINIEDAWTYTEPFIEPSLQKLMIPPSGQPDLMIPWPVKKEAVVEGDVNLGGLMMVHSREDGVTCGPIMPQGGIQALEAMLFTLDIINKKLRLVPNVTIGAHILDDCDKDTYGLEMAVDFIKGKPLLAIRFYSRFLAGFFPLDCVKSRTLSFESRVIFFRGADDPGLFVSSCKFTILRGHFGISLLTM